MANWHVRVRLHENLVNMAVAAMEAQRPSMFNYATKLLVKRNGACDKVNDPKTGASTYTVIDPLVIGQDNRMRLLAEYCYQIRKLNLDFSPLEEGGDEHFRLSADLVVGLGLPDKLNKSDMLLPGDPVNPVIDNFIDYDSIICYRSKLKVAGQIGFVSHNNKWVLLMQLTTFSLGASDGIYAMVEHYARTTINAVILPKAATIITPLEFDAPDERLPKISVALTPSPLPNPTFSSNTLELRLLTA